MIGANSLSPTVDLGAKQIRRVHRAPLRIYIGDQVRCVTKKMVCMKLGFRSEESSGEKTTKKVDLGGMLGMQCFKGGQSKERKMKEEVVNGSGEEIWEANEATEAKHFPEHLVVMVNGIIGSAEDWKYAAKQFVQKHPDKVIVHRSECNSSRLTFDGVDLMGERLAEEVLSVVKRRPGVQKISFVAHSLGGLVARYAIGRLYKPCQYMESSALPGTNENLGIPVRCQEQLPEGRIAGLVPLNFITFATPHLGSRGNKQLPFLCGLPFLERRASQTAHWIVGRSGKHLFLTDNDDEKPPLLLRMSNDCDDLKFISALRTFKRRVAYANANYDHMVGWRTSSIRRQHELPQSQLLVKYEKYPHIVHVDTTNDILKEESTHIRVQTIDMEEEMIRGLTQVSWERVDVSFRKSTQRYIAHNTIQFIIKVHGILQTKPKSKPSQPKSNQASYFNHFGLGT